MGCNRLKASVTCAALLLEAIVKALVRDRLNCDCAVHPEHGEMADSAMSLYENIMRLLSMACHLWFSFGC